MADQMVVEKQYDGYDRLFGEVKRRWREPSGHPTFGLFFFGSFMLFAAIGVWLEFFRFLFSIGTQDISSTALRTAIATYFPAILGAAVLQLLISETLRSLRALGFIIGVLFSALAFVLIFAEPLPNWIAIILGLFASVGALACWRIVYADDQSLRDDPESDPEVATGNIDPVAPLLGGDALNDYDA
ncbi:hypothetical protein A8A54_19635 [Brucella pseudogrignonensis]|uniref:hypothetical protein n=1 Tax=Brucella pseudogrignonensis TaxID=419475 RepID=UPI0007DAA363|nr:hypothetical protein [Brucella pseudogrignonensis]ANG98809.1 hypothetical protein A8A54_19635 [Brucella pseudogrignonensis]